MMAMFALFLKQRLGGCESFANKQKFFYAELKASRENLMRTSITILNVQRTSLVNSVS